MGRPLTQKEVVHHKDFDRLNNNPKNLMIFASHSDHAYYHQILKNPTVDYILYRVNYVYHCEPYQTFFKRETIHNAQNRRMKLCPQCGSIIYHEASLCLACTHKKLQKVARPSRNVLKTEIRTAPFTTIAKKYGVCDNTIRKWCKSYQLPYKTKEIKLISSKDWKYL